MTRPSPTHCASCDGTVEVNKKVKRIENSLELDLKVNAVKKGKPKV